MQELLRILWRGRLFILVVTAVTSILGAYYGFSLYTPSYRSSSLIDVSPYTYNPDRLVEKGRVLLQQKQGEFLNPEKMDIPVTAINGVRLEAIPKTDLVMVNVVYSNPEIALKTSRVVGEELLGWARLEQKEGLERKSKVLRTAINGINEELSALESKALSAGTDYPAGTYPHENLLSARAEVTAQLHTVSAEIEQLSTNPDLQPANFVYPGQTPASAATAQRLMYPVAALILGLLTSSLLVFLRYLWWTGDKEKIN